MAQDKTVMTLAEVARYLQLAKKTVLRMARQGKIPAAKVASQWRFLRPVIDEWLSHQMRQSLSMGATEMPLSLPRVEGTTAPFRPAQITLTLKPGPSDHVLEQLVSAVEAADLGVATGRLLGPLVERQGQMSMAAGPAVAICRPAAPLPGLVPEPSLALGVCKKGTDFGALDGSLTHVFILVCATDEKSDLALNARATWLSHQHDVLAELRKCGSRKKAAELLNGAGH